MIVNGTEQDSGKMNVSKKNINARNIYVRANTVSNKSQITIMSDIKPNNHYITIMSCVHTCHASTCCSENWRSSPVAICPGFGGQMSHIGQDLVANAIYRAGFGGRNAVSWVWWVRLRNKTRYRAGFSGQMSYI